MPGACARATCDRRDQSESHELAPLAAPSSTNAFTRVYINIIAAAPVRIVSSAALPLPPVWHDVTGSLQVELSPAATYTISQRTASTFLRRRTHASAHARGIPAARLTRSRTCTHTRVHTGVLRHVYRPRNDARSNTGALSHAKCSRGNTESKLRTGRHAIH